MRCTPGRKVRERALTEIPCSVLALSSWNSPVTFLIFHTFVYNFYHISLQANAWKITSATRRFLARLHPSNLEKNNLLARNLCLLFPNCSIFFKKLLNIRSPNKNSNWEDRTSTYPGCNACRYLFAYRGFQSFASCRLFKRIEQIALCRPNG